MRRIPNYIIDKLEKYHNYSIKVDNIRTEIEEWFIKQGMTEEYGNDYPITDILIDTSIDGNIDGAIILLEKELNKF